MRYFIFSSFCFVTLVYLIFHGVERYGKYLNPVFIFLLSVAIPVLYLLARRQRTEQRSGVPHILLRLLPLLAAVAGCGLIVTGYQQGFQEYLDYGRFSDVNLQIEALYDRVAIEHAAGA